MHKEIFEKIKIFYHNHLSIIDGTDSESTIKLISNDIEIRGANIWILICAAMLASIGLDVNSTAVIIGAMLISPLMSPILGIGLGVGISDRELLFKSLKNFGTAVGLSLLASAIYFKLTPLGMATGEMIARTSPTLLDVGVAVFGGVAGIVANSRREKTNAIPGVAIATALMPPLCTAGFGIASGNIQFFLGAFYLFFINAVFIALSTYFIVRILRFPHKEFIDYAKKRKMQYWIAAFAIIVIIPSAIIFFRVINEARTNKKIQDFLTAYVNNEKYEAIRWEIAMLDSLNTLKLFVIGEPISKSDSSRIVSNMQSGGLEDFSLKLIQMNVPQSERENIKKEVAGEVAMNVMKQLDRQKRASEPYRAVIDSLKREINRFSYDSASSAILALEIKSAFPEIKSFSIGKVSNIFNSQDSVSAIIITSYSKTLSKNSRNEINSKLIKFIGVKLGTDSLKLLLE